MPEEFTDKQLQFAYWFTRHSVTIKAVLLSLLFLIFSILIIYNTKQIIDFYAEDEIGRLQQEISIPNNFDIQRYKPRPVQFEQPVIVDRGDGRYDILVEVLNPNQKHRVKQLLITFTVGGWQSEAVVDYLLPAEKKTLMILNVEDKQLSNAISSGAQPKVNVGSIAWKRIRDIQWFDARGNFIDIGLEARNITTQQIGATTREVRFDLENNSVFNYRNVDVRVLLYNGREIVAAQQVRARDVRSDTVADYVIRWFYPLPKITNWKVELSTNVFDSDNILPFTLEQLGE